MSSTPGARPRWLEALLGLVIVALVVGAVVVMRQFGGDRESTAREAESSSSTSPTDPESAPDSAAAGSGTPSPHEPGEPGEPGDSGSSSPSQQGKQKKRDQNGVEKTTGGKARPQQLLSQAASDLAKAAEDAVPGEAAFRLGNFNVLGASHTRSGGKAAARPSGATRMRTAVHLMDVHRVDVVGFQEFEPEQSRAFDRLSGARWDSFPGTSGSADVRQTIAWRTDVWEPVKTTSVAVPYFDGNTVHSPVVLLRHRDSGREVWFANFHQAANTRRFHHQEAYRDQATQRQIALVRKLHADGTPVILTGDMNEREEYWCTMSAALPMVSADGSTRTAGGCRPAAKTWIDWIVGTDELRFSSYVRDNGVLAKQATDHPLVSVTALLGP